MAIYTGTINNTFTDAISEIQPSGMEQFIKQIKERIILKKLDKFKIIDYNIIPLKTPVLKPTLNSQEIASALSYIELGQLVLGKSTLSSKVMVYMDEEGIAWEVAALSDNTIINVEYCGKKPTEKKDEDNKSELSTKIEEIVNFVDSIDMTLTNTSINVYNKTESNEYKMIIGSVLNGTFGEPIKNIDLELIDQTIQQLNIVGPWKVINISSAQNDNHTFGVKDPNEKYWAVVTNWSINKIICCFQIGISE